MIGPVFSLELLHASRRGRQHLFRWIYASWLLLEFGLVLLLFLTAIFSTSQPSGSSTLGSASDYAVAWVQLFIVQQFVLLLLATPALAAGSITDEKTRGSLQHLLATDLTAREIILGKWLGQVAQIAALAVTGLPLLCFVGVFAGLDLPAVVILVAHSLVPLMPVAAASLLASVWCRTTTGAVLSLYICGAAGFGVVWLVGCGRFFNPLSVLDAISSAPGAWEPGRRLLGAFLAWGAVIPCLVLATWRLRPAYMGQLESRARRRFWWASRPTVSDRPIRWKERYAGELASLPGLRLVPRWARVGGIFILTVFSSSAILIAQRWTPAANLGFLVQGLVVAFLASSIVGIRSAGSVSSERERQTWEMLLVAPLATKQIIRSKLWGIIDAGRPYLFAYTVPALALSVGGGFRACFWTVLCWVLTWFMMYFMGAAGLDASARATSSWQGLLNALLYLDNLVIARKPIGQSAAGPADAKAEPNELAKLAATMKPGTWAELKTQGYNAELLKVQSHHILEYTDTAVWDPRSAQVLFVGQGHYSAVKFISYSAAANSWKLQPTPSWWKGDPQTGKGPIGHAYNNNAIDTAKHILYHHQSATRLVHRYDIAKEEWSTLPEIKDAATGHGTALVYFPEMKGLVRVLAGSVHFYDEEKNAWSLLKAKVPMGPYHNLAKYSPAHKAVIFGAGNNSKDLHLLDAKGEISKLPEAPILIRISSTVVTVDPASGDVLVLNMEDKNKFFALDMTKRQWQRLPDAPITSGVAAPVASLGVNFFFTSRPEKVYLYKHGSP